MGMQCHFNRADLPEGTAVEHIYFRDSDTWTAQIKFPNHGWIEVCSAGPKAGSFWFDIGQQNQYSKMVLSLLITFRVCFNCS